MFVLELEGFDRPVDRLRSAVEGLAAENIGRTDDEELMESTAEILQLLERARANVLDRVAEIDRRKA